MKTPGGSMTKAELVEEVSRVSDLTKKHSEVIVDTVFKSIIDALHRGEKIELRGFGSFRLRKREPRKGRNPKTGDKVDVPPKKVPYFKPGKELKDLINREEENAEISCRGGPTAAIRPFRPEPSRDPGPGSDAHISPGLDADLIPNPDPCMDRLWTPWRLDYVKANRSELECVFCLTAEVSAATGQAVDAHVVDPLVVHLGRTAYVILNRYPYNNGHLMVVPRRHVATLTGLTHRGAARDRRAHAAIGDRACARRTSPAASTSDSISASRQAAASSIICTCTSFRAGSATPTS